MAEGGIVVGLYYSTSLRAALPWAAHHIGLSASSKRVRRRSYTCPNDLWTPPEDAA